MRVSRIASVVRSRRTGSVSGPVARYPSLKTRKRTARTPETRAGRSSADGTRYGMRAALILAFARVIRWPIAAFRHQERTGDLGHGQAADHPQRQRDARLHRECRVTAGEDQPKSIVVQGTDGLGGPVAVRHLRLPLLVVALGFASDPVDGLAVRSGRQPGAGVRGHTVGRPSLGGRREGLRRRLLGDVEVTEPPGQGGDHPRPLLVVGLGDRLPDVDQRSPYSSLRRDARSTG